MRNRRRYPTQPEYMPGASPRRTPHCAPQCLPRKHSRLTLASVCGRPEILFVALRLLFCSRALRPRIQSSCDAFKLVISAVLANEEAREKPQAEIHRVLPHRIHLPFSHNTGLDGYIYLMILTHFLSPLEHFQHRQRRLTSFSYFPNHFYHGRKDRPSFDERGRSNVGRARPRKDRLPR